MTRRINGFITLSRAAFFELDHEYTLPKGTKYVYVRLAMLVDHRTGGMVFNLADLVEQMNDRRSSVYRAVKRLEEVGLVLWEPARNQEIAGQLRLPFYGWSLGVEDADLPALLHRRFTAVSPPSRGRNDDPPSTSEKEPLRIQEVKKSRSTSNTRISKSGNADVRDTEEAEPETPEDWEQARAKVNDPAFQAQLEAELQERQRREAEANEA
jgi:hypothetical protein